MADLRTIGSHAAGLAWVAFRAFASTLAAFAAAGVVLAGMAYCYLREPQVGYGVLGAAVALAESLAAGFFLGLARAKAAAIVQLCGELHVGRSLVTMVFDRMIRVADGEHGERGGKLAQSLERVPLAQAEELLKKAVRGVVGEVESGSWLRRKVRVVLTEAVRRYTLAHFRVEGAAHGGIDLYKVRGELEHHTIDDIIATKVRAGLRLWLWLAVVGLPVAVAVQIYLAMGFAKVSPA